MSNEQSTHTQSSIVRNTCANNEWFMGIKYRVPFILSSQETSESVIPEMPFTKSGGGGSRKDRRYHRGRTEWCYPADAPSNIVDAFKRVSTRWCWRATMQEGYMSNQQEGNVSHKKLSWFPIPYLVHLTFGSRWFPVCESSISQISFAILLNNYRFSTSRKLIVKKRRRWWRRGVSSRDDRYAGRVDGKDASFVKGLTRKESSNAGWIG